MREEILDLEADFSNNEYFGTNVWTEEKYRVLSGSIPVLLSAPHSVNQFRGDDVRDAEKYTGALVRYLNKTTGAFSVFQIFTHADPNADQEHNYKNGIINLINNYNIKALIDIHSSNFKNNADIDIVTNQRLTLCGEYDIIDAIKKLGNKYDLVVEENNVPNKEKENEIIFVTSLICGIPSIRIVINNNSLDIDKDCEKINKLIHLIEDLIAVLCK